MNIHPYSPKHEYSRRQMGYWKVLLDITNAQQFGFDKYRLATPSKPIKVKDAQNHVYKMEAEWKHEWTTRDPQWHYNGVPQLTKLNQSTKVYLHNTLQKIRNRADQIDRMTHA